jgi:pSer/pThr/pTyr-binding forkhead associated (FHA) protein
MSSSVVLSVKEGGREVKTLTFHDHTFGIVGRASNCYIQLPNDVAHLVVSRHHCLLEIDPPNIRVQDLGSRNGTFVNEVKIGQRRREVRTGEMVDEDRPFFPLKDGDELRLGDTIIKVGIATDADGYRDDQDEGFEAFGQETRRAGERDLCGSAY